MVDSQNNNGMPSPVEMLHSVSFIAGNIFANNPTMNYEDAVDHAWQIYTKAYTKGVQHLEYFNRNIVETMEAWGADGPKN